MSEYLKKEGESDLHQCPACGFHYKEKEWADKCQAWCIKNQSCNLEITAHSEEDKN